MAESMEGCTPAPPPLFLPSCLGAAGPLHRCLMQAKVRLFCCFKCTEKFLKGKAHIFSSLGILQQALHTVGIQQDFVVQAKDTSTLCPETLFLVGHKDWELFLNCHNFPLLGGV